MSGASSPDVGREPSLVQSGDRSAAKPLASFIVLAFKQEQFIEEAVRSALAQTYEPLEVVLSDDCSPDRTFEIMENVAREYRGPHKVIRNRNERNEGLAEHFNRAFARTSGEVIVLQGGDDVSTPRRTERIMAVWSQPTPVDLVFSNVEVIDAEGAAVRKRWFEKPYDPAAVTVARVLAGTPHGVLGCSAAYSRDLITKYGPLDPDITAEDSVLGFRAMLERGIRFLDENLVRYRTHDSNLVFGSRIPNRRDERRRARGRLAILREQVRVLKQRGNADDSLLRQLRQREVECHADVRCFDRGRLGSLIISAHGLCAGMSLRKVAGLIGRHVLRWSPARVERPEAARVVAATSELSA